jgi:peptidase M1-like protein
MKRLHRNVMLKLSVAVGIALLLAVAPSSVQGQATQFEPGAPGAGDPYFPLDGNGGYNVRHYLLDVTYNPRTDVLQGVATIRVRATQNLSRFNLDFDGLRVLSVTVDGRPAAWTRNQGELRITPSRGIFDTQFFTVVVRYRGIPETILDVFGYSGFFHTDDGALVLGEPRVASTWYPVNDHPSDKATYRFKITVPNGLEAIANGALQSRRTAGGWTTWTWQAREPMASYLTTATIGQFDLRSYTGTIAGNRTIRYWDAIDPDLFDPVAVPRTGSQFAFSQQSEPSYKRLARTISVPAAGARLSFWVDRDTEFNWDYVFVEAHPVGANNWTTLRDLNGHTSMDTGFSCPYWLPIHPFLAHYQTDNGDGTCSPRGATGRWWAATGASGDWERWRVDLSRYAGRNVEISITYASDDIFQAHGVFVDDIVVSTGQGSTSFENDGNPLDGWTVPGAPPGSQPNPNDWIVATVDDAPAPFGEVAENSLARQNEILNFLSQKFGPYPFGVAGGIVDDEGRLFFALENQTRPIYSKYFFYEQISGDSVVVHELAHQWYGDSLAVARWQHIWLNEGFATYAEWLWAEREKLATAQESFDGLYNAIPAEDPFWSLTIGDPGPDHLFDFAVYGRGAMTLHQLRLEVGDADFFRILRQWTASQANGYVTTNEFIALAEEISGENLDQLFDTWLFTGTKPALGTSASAGSAAARSLATRSAASVTRLHVRR